MTITFGQAVSITVSEAVSITFGQAVSITVSEAVTITIRSGSVKQSVRQPHNQ